MSFAKIYGKSPRIKEGRYIAVFLMLDLKLFPRQKAKLIQKTMGRESRWQLSEKPEKSPRKRE